MFNRSTKLTALLVAAASIASSVPAMAATKLANKTGTVENAVSFKDGKYLYEGYRTDDDQKGLYYNAGESDKMLDDADTLGVKYDDKYVSAFDGNDEYIVDLSTGKITDDDTLTDSKETAETKLSNKLKKTDRYGSDFNEKEDSPNKITAFNAVTEGNLEDVWYQYQATTAGGTTFGYTNASGTYIDCSFDLNVYAYSSNNGKGKMYKLEDVEDTADLDNGKTASISDVKFDRYLGQDDKYIYSLIQVKIENAQDIKTDGSAKGEYNQPNSEARYFVQKVSKAQGDKKDDAYKPKSTECFEVTKNFDNGDCADGYDALIDKYADSQANDYKYDIKAIDGALYVSYTDGEKVKTVKVALKTSEKLKTGGSTAAVDKVSGRVARKDGDTDTKADDWTIDVNGTVWAIYNGEIKKSVKKDSFETVYTCDRSLDAIDVYDENNLIAWDVNGDVYTTVQEGSDAAKKEAEEIVGEQPAPVAKTGWQQDATTGTWTLYDAVGTQLTGWQLVGGKYYYMDPATGIMKTGWVQSPASGKYYYMDPVNGDMKTGWQKVDGKWYYMNPSNGDMQTGWVYDGSNWYYMYSDGSMAYNTTIDGYVLNASGAWIN